MDFPALAFGIKRVVVGRIKQNIKTVSSGESGPIGISNLFFALDATRANPVLVVLQSAGDSKIRLRIVEAYPAKLTARKFVQVIPILAARKTLIEAAIGPEQQSQTNRRFRWFVLVFGFRRFGRRRAVRLNREGVAIGMNFLRKIFAEVFATVIGHHQSELQKIDALIVPRIDPNLAEIKRARIDCAHPGPMSAAVSRSKQAATFAAQIA